MPGRRRGTLESADPALFAAKAGGRDRTHVGSDSLQPPEPTLGSAPQRQAPITVDESDRQHVADHGWHWFTVDLAHLEGALDPFWTSSANASAHRSSPPVAGNVTR